MLKALIFISVFIFSACSPAEGNDASIAVLIKGMSNPYWKTLHDGVIDVAKEIDADVYIQGAQNDDGEAQLNICNTMLLKKPDALIFAAVNNVNLTPCLQKAQEQGVLLVDVDGNVGQEDAKNMGVDVAFSIASDNYDLGKKAALYLNEKGVSGKVLLLEGLPGSVPGIQRAKGFNENINDGLQVVSSISGHWDRLKAADITTDTLTKHPDLAAVFAANDMMALGAAEVLRAKGVEGVTVIGIDGVADAVKAIKADRLTASIAQLPYLMGREAILKTHAYLMGKEQYDFDQKVPIVTLDKAALSAGEEPLLDYVR